MKGANYRCYNESQGFNIPESDGLLQFPYREHLKNMVRELLELSV